MAVTGGGLLDEVQKIQEKALVYNGHFAEFVSWADGIRDDGSRRRHYIKNFPGEGWDVNEITDSLGQLISQWETYGIIPLNTDIKLVKWIGRVESYVEVHKNAKESLVRNHQTWQGASCRNPRLAKPDSGYETGRTITGSR
ncbi:MAG: hypothetical protein ACLR23_07220 [Clostridia bacterium]